MELTADDKKELQLAFNLFDSSKSGTSPFMPRDRQIPPARV